MTALNYQEVKAVGAAVTGMWGRPGHYLMGDLKVLIGHDVS